jgi:hypothetical protein
MKRLFLVAAITSLLLTMASISWAASNLNFSKSNINRMVSDPAVVSPTQAAAILAEVTKIGPGVNVVKLKEILSKVGVKLGHLQVIEIMPPAKKGEPPLILLLANPMDKARAIRTATGDVEWPGPSK